MATLTEIHNGIFAQLSTIAGLRAFNTPTQGAVPPLAWPQLTGWQAETFSRGRPRVVRFDVYVFTAQAVRPEDGYLELMTFGESVDLAVWDGNNPTAGTFAGLAATQAFCNGFRALNIQEVDTFQMYGGVFTVEVHTRST